MRLINTDVLGWASGSGQVRHRMGNELGEPGLPVYHVSEAEEGETRRLKMYQREWFY